MTKARRVVVVVVAAAVLLAAAVGAYLKFGKSAAADDGAGGSGDDSAGASPGVAAESFATDVAIPVEGAVVLRDTLVVSVSAAAQSAARREAKLLAQVEGRVTEVRVRDNSPVREGQVLLTLDSTEYSLGLDRARANLARAQASFRELTLFDDQIPDTAVRGERERVARAKSGLAEAEVSVREAQLRLERSRITAPFSGRVASVKVVPGQNARPGDELVTVVDLNPIKVEVQVLESEVALLTAGRRAVVAFAAFPGEPFTGRIETINPMVERETRTARVTVVVPNPGGRILPGMYARVSLEARKFPDRILVPRAAVLERDRRSMLFVFEGEGSTGLSKWRYVTVGLANDSLVEIVQNPETEMVEPGEVVLVDGHYTLIHDARVRLVQSVREAGGRPR
jgi:membrane fusion protein, multidrug efflux system